MSASTIVARIEAALEKAVFRKMKVRAIYLDEADRQAYTKANTRYWRKQLGSKAIFHPLSFGDHPIRYGSRSRIYDEHGVEIAIPKRLSPRVRAAA